MQQKFGINRSNSDLYQMTDFCMYVVRGEKLRTYGRRQTGLRISNSTHRMHECRSHMPVTRGGNENEARSKGVIMGLFVGLVDVVWILLRLIIMRSAG